MRFHFTLLAGITVAILGIVFPSPPLFAQVNGADDLEGVAEDVEIMRRILVRSLNTRFHGTDPKTEKSGLPSAYDSALSQYRLAQNQTLNLYASLTSARGNDFGSKGFYVPGTGVVYTLGLSVPTRTAPSPAEEEPPGNDLWSRTKRELRNPTRQFAIKSEPARESILDPDAIRSVTTTLLETIGENGANIAKLGPSESIILTIELNGREGSARGDFAALYSGSLPGRSKSGRLIIQVPRSAMTRFQSDHDFTGLRQAARVTTY